MNYIESPMMIQRNPATLSDLINIVAHIPASSLFLTSCHINVQFVIVLFGYF